MGNYIDPCCPVCGKKAMVIHMVDRYDRADFGWDCGCSAFKLDDGIHGVTTNTPAEDSPRVTHPTSKEGAIAAWEMWVREWSKRHEQK